MNRFKMVKKLSSEIEFFKILLVVCVLIGVLIVNVNVQAQSQDLSGFSGSASTSSPSQISIDFKSVQISKIYPDSTGTISFIIANVGGLPAEEIEISIPSSQNFHIGDTIKIGTLNPGTRQGIQTTIKTSNIAPGTYTITVITKYKKQKREVNEGIVRVSVEENFYIPIKVYAPPTTELNIKNEELFINKEQKLNLEIIPKANLNDASVELISDCLQIVGNSKIYIGNLNANKGKTIQFSVIPSKKGCGAKLNLIYEAGEYEIETLNFGLKISEIFVDFLTEIENKEISPGDSLNLTINTKNLGNIKLQNIKFSLNLPERFVVANEVFFENILPNEEKHLNFQIYVKEDTGTGPYKGNLEIEYEISGTKYQMMKDVGIIVEGKILLVITNYAIENDKVNVEIANLGTRDAKAIILKLGDGYYYIDKIASTKKRIAVFQLEDVKDTQTLTIEYTASNNERVKFEEKISLNVNIYANSRGENNLLILLILITVIAIVGFFIYKRMKKKRESE